MDELNHKSVVTYATLRHPRYGLTSADAKNINTECGEEIRKNNKKSVDVISDTEQKLITAFRLADIGNQNVIKFKRDYGGENKEVIYRLYNVVDRRVQPNIETAYAAQIVYKCDGNDILRKRLFIESVSIINTGTGSAQSFRPDGTPDDLHEYTGAPYLYSVNNSRQYFLLMDKLSEKFESRALAGYFLAGFNRSCRGKDRKRVKSCQHRAYEFGANN